MHDRRTEGLFARATWRKVLTDAGFEVDTFPRQLDDGAFDEVFVCRRPHFPSAAPGAAPTR